MSISRCFSLFLACFGLLAATTTFAAVTTEGDAFFDGSSIRVAQQGDGSLAITPPDLLFVPSEILIGGSNFGGNAGFTGSVNVDGASLIFDGFRIDVGEGEQSHGTLEVKNGGSISSNNQNSSEIQIAGAESALGMVNVLGEGSRLSLPTSDIFVGARGVGDLQIRDGGRVDNQGAIVGGYHNSEGTGYGTATVSGDRSEWNLQGPLVVGNNGSGRLRIEDGGLVRSGTFREESGLIGNSFEQFSSSSGTVNVVGLGSKWLHQGELVVGANGTGNLNISAGGMVASGLVRVADNRNFGASSSNSSGLITVDGPGSQLNIAGLMLGGTGTGQILLTNGAKLVSNSQFGEANGTTTIGNQPGSYGRLVVDGATTQWLDNAQNIDIGAEGTGELIIQNGAIVSNRHVSLGRRARSSGSNTAKIAGPGTRWHVDSIVLGGRGTGKVEIVDGAVLQVNSNNGGTTVINGGGELFLDHGTFLATSFGTEIRNSGGLIRGSGEIHSRVFNGNGNGGAIRVGSSDRLLLAESLHNDAGGRVDVVGGELEVRGEFYNYSEGTVALENATLRVETHSFSPVVNDGSLLVAAGENRVYGTIQNDSQGRIILSGNSQTTFYDGVQNDGTINVSTGSVATFFGEVSGNGVGGGGTVFLEGPVSPGFSPGVMAFGGDVTLGDFSDLNIEIGEEVHDMLEIVGDATLGGELILAALEALAGDTTVEIIAADSVFGTFDSVPEPGTSLGFGVLFDGITYNEDSVVISLLQQTADFDTNNFVDSTDLDTFADGYGSGTTLAEGDADRDGDVDGSDFLQWQQQFTGATTSLATNQTVPEPTAAMLVLLAGVAVSGIRRR